jgi:creatinine amidohydrolase
MHMKRKGANMISSISTADEIAKGSGKDIAVIPIGSTEQHGPHLPVATDYIIAEAYAKSIGEKLEAFVLPVLPISTCREHMGKRGSVWIKADTFYHVIQDIVLSLKEQGFKTMIIILSHGGIFIANPAIRELNAANQDIKVIKLETMQFDKTKEMLEITECSNNLHACEIETSLMLYLDGKLVRKELIEDCVPDVPRDYLNYRSIFCYTKNGVWGKPSLATAEKGRKIFELVVEKGVEYINNIIGMAGGKTYIL